MTTSEQHEGAKARFTDILNDQQLISALNNLQITEPTEVQAAAIPVAMQGRDLVVQAQTGSGKTLAFVLPLIKQIRACRGARGTLALIVTPTRELALQVQSVVQSIAPDISPACLIGGASAGKQVKDLRHDARMVIGTPGRLLDFLRQRVLLLRKCRAFVLDEADEMLSMGFIDEVRAILTKLPRERQGMLFSATITSRVLGLANMFLKKPEMVTIETAVEDAAKIEHFYCNVDGGVTSKVNALCQLFKMEAMQSAIVFCNTKSDTELVEAVLRRRGFNARRINSDLSQRERDAVIASVHSGELQFLIATDVAARGIDIKDLPLVVNYSLHDQAEIYVHRTGRTGRAGASGKAICLIGPQDSGAFYALKRQLGIELTELVLPDESAAEIPVQSGAARQAA